jgi:hypothetical protein
MALTKLQFKPGIVRDTTDYTNEGGWRSCDKIRFRFGYPETIGGWSRLTSTTMLGSCRSLHVWSTLTGTNYISAGTNLKLYIVNGSVPTDITPVRREVTRSNPLSSLYRLNLTTISPNLYFVPTETITSSSGGTAVVAEYSSNGGYILVLLNSITGTLDNTDTITGGTSTATGVISSQLFSQFLNVEDTSHGAENNDFVRISGVVGLGGEFTGLLLNKEFQITSVTNVNNYIIDIGVNADGSDTGLGGAAVVFKYDINTGLDTVLLGAGWSAGEWGSYIDGPGWGQAADTSLPGAQLRLWSFDNFGEDLVANVRGGGVYYWDNTTGLAVRAVNIVDLAGANSAPTVANTIIVSERDRHVIAFGCDPEFDPGNLDPLVIRFSDQESVTDWETREDNSAGEIRIGTGTQIVAAVQTKQQTIVITDASVHALQYIGAPFVFGISEVSSNTSILSQNCAVAINDSVYWMGDRVFYKYDGNVQLIPCPVKEYIFADMNLYQLGKVVAASNSKFNEIWWFYPSSNSSINDRYVVLNYAENIWYYGTLNRTAWNERGVSGFPISASTDGYIYFHENGLNDGSTNPPQPLSCFIESSSIDMGDGDQFMFVTKIIPDMTFRNSVGQPQATMSISSRTFPGADFDKTTAQDVTRTTALPVEQYTEQLFVRLRGRSIALKIESNQLDTQWRLGSPRIDVRSDGRR